MKNIFYIIGIFFLLSYADNSFGQDVIAHRGGASLSPENTLLAFQTAIDLGVEYFELDIRVSADDYIMVMHDEKIDRTTNGNGNIADKTYSQLRELDAGSWFDPSIQDQLIPTLEEVLILTVPSVSGIIIELKAISNHTIQEIIDLLYLYNMQDRVIIAAFDFNKLTTVKSIDSNISIMQFGSYSKEKIEHLKSINGEWFGTSSQISTNDINYAHINDILINKWTINTSSTMKELIAIQVDAITTDYPQVLIPLVDKTPPDIGVLNIPIVSETTIGLTWEESIESDGKIKNYIIYKDTKSNPTKRYATTTDTMFQDDNNLESTKYYYRISAVNEAGLSSSFSNVVNTMTGDDHTAPYISQLVAKDDNQQIIISFSEKMNQSRLENISNYSIDGGVDILDAVIGLDSSSVIIKTTSLEETTYELNISNVIDKANSPNLLNKNIYQFKYAPLHTNNIMYLGLDQLDSEKLYDAAIETENGTGFNGVKLTDGMIGNALQFDGIDDYVNILQAPSIINEVSISVWVKLAYAPIDLPTKYGPIFDSETDNYILYEDRDKAELRFKVTTSNGATRPGIKSSELQTNKWIHIVGVYDGSTAKIYLNGDLKDTHTNITGKVKPGQNIKLGESLGSFFKGSIDLIQVFNSVLDLDDINKLYHRENNQLLDSKNIALETKCIILNQNYPNPFSKASTITYYIPNKGKVQIDVYDTKGKKILNLVNKIQARGHFFININNANMPSGQYLYKLTYDGKSVFRKMIVI